MNSNRDGISAFPFFEITRCDKKIGRNMKLSAIAGGNCWVATASTPTMLLMGDCVAYYFYLGDISSVW